MKDIQGIQRGKCNDLGCDCEEYRPPKDSGSLRCEYCGHPPGQHVKIIDLGECNKCGKDNCSKYEFEETNQYTDCAYCGCGAVYHAGSEKLRKPQKATAAGVGLVWYVGLPYGSLGPAGGVGGVPGFQPRQDAQPVQTLAYGVCVCPGCHYLRRIEGGRVLDYCSETCSKKHAEMQASSFHQADASAVRSDMCKTPGCPRQRCAMDGGSGYFDYFSKLWRNEGQQPQPQSSPVIPSAHSYPGATEDVDSLDNTRGGRRSCNCLRFMRSETLKCTCGHPPEVHENLTLVTTSSSTPDLQEFSDISTLVENASPLPPPATAQETRTKDKEQSSHPRLTQGAKSSAPDPPTMGKKSQRKTYVVQFSDVKSKGFGLIFSEVAYTSDCVHGLLITGVKKESAAYEPFQNDILRLLDVVVEFERKPVFTSAINDASRMNSFSLTIDRSISLAPTAYLFSQLKSQSRPFSHILVLRSPKVFGHKDFGVDFRSNTDDDVFVSSVSSDTSSRLSGLLFDDRIVMCAKAGKQEIGYPHFYYLISTFKESFPVEKSLVIAIQRTRITAL